MPKQRDWPEPVQKPDAYVDGYHAAVRDVTVLAWEARTLHELYGWLVQYAERVGPELFWPRDHAVDQAREIIARLLDDD